MNDETKKMIKRKNWLFQNESKSGNPYFAILNSRTQDISNAIAMSELKYHEHLAIKLTDPKRASKTYWEILISYANGTKVSLITPLLVGNQRMTFGKSKFVQ